MPRKCAIGTVKTMTASGPLALDEPLEVPAPARRHPAPDRLPHRGGRPSSSSGRSSSRRRCVSPLSRARPSRAERERLALAIGRVRRGPPPGRLHRPAAVRRDDQVDAALVQPLPELPPRRRAAVAEVEVDGGRDGEDLHPWSVSEPRYDAVGAEAVDPDVADIDPGGGSAGEPGCEGGPIKERPPATTMRTW